MRVLYHMQRITGLTDQGVYFNAGASLQVLHTPLGRWENLFLASEVLRQEVLAGATPGR